MQEEGVIMSSVCGRRDTFSNVVQSMPTSSYGSQLCTIVTLEPVENKWGMYNILIKDVHASGMWSEGLGVMDMPIHTCCVGGWWNAV